MTIPIKQIILEITALKSRQMSLKAGIIPDYTSDWKGALKKVRGARGELLSGKELNQAKLQMGYPENNVLQKLKSMERKTPLYHEVGYDPKNKEFIKGGFNNVSPANYKKDLKIPTNNKQIGFIHTHPLRPTLRFGKYQEEIPSGIPDRSFKTNGKMVGQKKGISTHLGDMDIFRENKNTKFPIYVPERNVLSVTSLKDKSYLSSEKEKYLKQKDKLLAKQEDIYTKFENRPDINKREDLWSKETKELSDAYDKLLIKRKEGKARLSGYIKPNHIKFMVNKNNYQDYNLNGQRI